MKWCGGAAVMMEMVTTAFVDGSNDVGGVGWRLMMMLGDDDGEVVRGVAYRKRKVQEIKGKSQPGGVDN
ncbi:hypothetical protein Tco_0269544 [Tanacetum coccineum]